MTTDLGPANAHNQNSNNGIPSPTLPSADDAIALTIDTSPLPKLPHAAQLTPALLALSDTAPTSAEEQTEPRPQSAVLVPSAPSPNSDATYGRPSPALDTRSASVDLGQRTHSSSVVEGLSASNLLRRASAQVLPGPLISLVPSASSSKPGGTLAQTGQAVLGIVGAGGASSGILQSPPLNPTQNHIPRSSILLKHSNRPSLTHLEWYELHNGVPLALRIPAPITQKQREREKQLEREAREREREKEAERERDKERAERNKLEERIWGIPKKALLLGLPEVNFNAQMAMLGGWGNGSGGPTASSTPSTPSKHFLKEREREKVRQREREKQREAEEAQEPLDPEELAALNAIINTRRSMAAAQALASGHLIPSRPRRTSINAASVANTSLAPTTTSSTAVPSTSGESSGQEESIASRGAGGGAQDSVLDSARSDIQSIDGNRYNRSHHDSITSSTMSLISNSTTQSAAGQTGPSVGSGSVAGQAHSQGQSLATTSAQSPVLTRYAPRIRFAPLPLPPPVDISSPIDTVGPGEDDRASSIFDANGPPTVGTDAGLGADETGRDLPTPTSMEEVEGLEGLSQPLGEGDPQAMGDGDGGAARAEGRGSRSGDDTSLRAGSHLGNSEGRRNSTGASLSAPSGSGGAAMRQSFDSGRGEGADGIHPSPGITRQDSASASSSITRKRPRFPRTDSLGSSQAGSSARDGLEDDDSDREEMDDEGWRKRLSGGKGKWYLMGMPTSMFKSIRRPGTADSSRRKRGFGEGSSEAEESEAGRLTRRLSTGAVTSPGEASRKGSTAGMASLSSTLSSLSTSPGSTGGNPLFGSSSGASGGLAGSISGAGFMSFFGRSDDDAEDRGRPSLANRGSWSRASSRSHRRSGSRGSARSRERERDRDIDYFTDEEERARRRKLVRSIRPGGTGMVTLPDGTKIPARRVVDAASEGDDKTGATSGGYSAFDEEFDFSQWGFAGLARRCAGLNTGTTTTTGTGVSTSVVTDGGATVTDSGLSSTAAEPSLPTGAVTPAADVIAARIEKKSAAGSAEEVKRKYAEAEALKASQSEKHDVGGAAKSVVMLQERRTGSEGLAASAVLMARRPSGTSTVGPPSVPQTGSGLSDGDGDTTVTPHSTPKAHTGGNALAPLTALTPLSGPPRSPAIKSRAQAPGGPAPAKTTTATSDVSATAGLPTAPEGAAAGKEASALAGSAQWPAISAKASTPGLGLTLERAEIIRKRHEAEVAALGAEILANVKGPRRRSSTDDIVVSSSNKDQAHDKEVVRTNTVGGGKDSAVLSKSKHERVGGIFAKDKHKPGTTAVLLPSVPSSPGEPSRSKGKSDPPRGRRMDVGHEGSRSNSLALKADPSPTPTKEHRRVGTVASPDATPLASPAIGHEGTPKSGQVEFQRRESPSPHPRSVSETVAPPAAAALAEFGTNPNPATRSNLSLGSSLGRPAAASRARSARSPDARKINVDPKISMPAPLDWLPRRPDMRGHHVVPLPQLGVRPRRPREGRVWDGWGYFSESDEEDRVPGDKRGVRSDKRKAQPDSDSDSDEDDDLDPETIAAEDRKTKFQQSRLTTKAAGQEIVHQSRAASTAGRRESAKPSAPIPMQRRASAGGMMLSVSPVGSAHSPALRSASSATSLGRSEALPVPRQARHVSSASSMRNAGRSLSQSPSTSRPPAPSTVIRDDDLDDAEFWSPSALQTMTKSSVPSTSFSETAASASVRSRMAREKRLKKDQSQRQQKSERRDSLTIDYGWSASHHPSLFDNR